MFTPGGDSSQMVRFPVFDDTINEYTKGFIIVLDANETQTQVSFNPALRTTLGRINDNDRKQ